ncbi:MAG: helix-turn-helix domain-containing protein [Actinomycetota bacterium]
MKTYSDQIAQVSTALADPTRREIMEYVLRSDSPLSVREVADFFGLHANAARMHLDKLVKGGLLRIVRQRGARGGRPAHLYDASGEELDLNLPPRRYKLLAEVLAGGLADGGASLALRMGDEAYARGREEAVTHSSPLAFIKRGAGMREVAEAWSQEIERRGHKATLKHLAGGDVEARFITCPFGEFSRNYPGLVCEIHRRMEEGFLSLGGRFILEATGESCVFVMRDDGPE